MKMIKTIKRHKIAVLMLAALISAAGFYSCGNSSVTTPPTNNLSFSVKSSMDSAGDSQSILVLDTVKILIKDIKLDLNTTSEDSSDFQIGPFVLFLNLSSDFKTISSAILPIGTYDRVKFEVHKLNDNEAVPDAEFADANGRYSVIVKGYYLGNYFVYKSTKSAHQILNFPSTLPITSAFLSNITMVVKPYICTYPGFAHS